MYEKIIITIDGPSGVGKGTIAKIIADKLGFSYLDTGAMYRAVALKIATSMENIESEKELVSVLDNTKISFSDGRIFLDSEDVSKKIRTEMISKLASDLATKRSVRDFLVKIQRKIGEGGNLVAEGRDMGTVVFPDAKYKYYIDATPEVRAKRRFKQLNQPDLTYSDVLEEIKTRDNQDMNRKESPLQPSVNAVIIDTTNLKISEVVGKILLNVGGSVQ